jgi:23S rRNA (adenine2503-C2)-methyltransferase
MRDPNLKPTNIVFMGMGEPLLNWDAVDTTLTTLNQPAGFGIGARHITLSTVGILPNLAKFAQRSEQFRLAVSLHAPSPVLRRELMPIEKKYTLPELMEASAASPPGDASSCADRGGTIAGNGGSAGADRETAEALVNLLPLHPGGAPDLTPSPRAQMLAFARRLKQRGVEAVLRRSRGLDISAACGQLRVEVEGRTRRGKIRAEEHAHIE